MSQSEPLTTPIKHIKQRLNFCSSVEAEATCHLYPFLVLGLKIATLNGTFGQSQR